MNSVIRRTGTYFHLLIRRIGRDQGARAPHHRADAREAAQAVDRFKIEHALLRIVHNARRHRASGVEHIGGEPGRRLPHAAAGVGRRIDAGDEAADGATGMVCW